MSMIMTLTAISPGEINRILTSTEQLDDILADPSREVSLEKAWHGLHFLLTGSSVGGSGPEAFLLLGGEPVGGDRGYGPARLLRPDAVHPLSANLSSLSDDRLWSRFDADRMTEEGVYPVIWDEPEDELKSEYLAYFHAMKELVSRASASEKGVVIVLQ